MSWTKCDPSVAIGDGAGAIGRLAPGASAPTDVTTGIGDRQASLLRVPALHLEPGSGAVEARAAEAKMRALAAWLGLDGVEIERTIPAPKGKASAPKGTPAQPGS